MGKRGCGMMNDNGKRLVDFCLNNNCIVGGIIFPHKNIHKTTRRPPDGKTCNQIDHIVINGKWRGSLHDVRGRIGADVNSCYHLLITHIQLKLHRAVQRSERRKKARHHKTQTPKHQ